MAAGAREQAASCDAFVLSRRLPAPDAPLKRGISFAKIRGFKVADYSPCPAGLAVESPPMRGTSTDALNTAVRTRGVFTHRDDFQKPACVERGLVRTGTSLWPGWDCHCEFRQARSGTPLPDGVLAVVGMTDGVWQGGSVMSTLRRGPCRASRHDRG